MSDKKFRVLGNLQGVRLISIRAVPPPIGSRLLDPDTQLIWTLDAIEYEKTELGVIIKDGWIGLQLGGNEGKPLPAPNAELEVM